MNKVKAPLETEQPLGLRLAIAAKEAGWPQNNWPKMVWTRLRPNGQWNHWYAKYAEDTELSGVTVVAAPDILTLDGGGLLGWLEAEHGLIIERWGKQPGYLNRPCWYAQRASDVGKERAIIAKTPGELALLLLTALVQERERGEAAETEDGEQGEGER